MTFKRLIFLVVCWTLTLGTSSHRKSFFASPEWLIRRAHINTTAMTSRLVAKELATHPAPMGMEEEESIQPRRSKPPSSAGQLFWRRHGLHGWRAGDSPRSRTRWRHSKPDETHQAVKIDEDSPTGGWSIIKLRWMKEPTFSLLEIRPCSKMRTISHHALRASRSSWNRWRHPPRDPPLRTSPPKTSPLSAKFVMSLPSILTACAASTSASSACLSAVHVKCVKSYAGFAESAILNAPADPAILEPSPVALGCSDSK